MRRFSAEGLLRLLSDVPSVVLTDSKQDPPVVSTDLPPEAPPVVSTDLPTFLIDSHEGVQGQMDEFGFVVVPQLVPADACEALKEAMIARAQGVLQLMGVELGEDCGGLLRIGKQVNRSPHPDWLASGKELPWAAFGKQGYLKSVGSGRLFQGAFADEPAMLAVQEHTRGAVAFFHGVDPRTLVRQPDKCSIKPPGSPRLVPHLDRERRGTFQAIACVACVDSHVARSMNQ